MSFEHHVHIFNVPLGAHGILLGSYIDHASIAGITYTEACQKTPNYIYKELRCQLQQILDNDARKDAIASKLGTLIKKRVRQCCSTIARYCVKEIARV